MISYSMQGKLYELADWVHGQAQGLFDSGIGNIQDIWRQAIRSNRQQNKLISEGNGHDVVRVLDFYSQQVNDICKVNVRAKKAYSRKQWFVLLYMQQGFCTLEQTKQAVEGMGKQQTGG